MIHLISSEALAALICLILFSIAIAAYLLQLSWWCAMTEADKFVAFLSCLFACRGVASGRRCKWPDGVDFSSRVALVTGASSGVGFGVTQELAQHGWTVIMAGRDVSRLLQARQSIMTRRKLKGRLVVLGTVDLADLDSVRQFAASVLEQKERLPLSLLVNAAGVLRRHLHRCEDTGMEEMISTNVLGPMLLTELLLPLLDKTAEDTGVTSRIVNVASSCHTFLGVRQRKWCGWWRKQQHEPRPQDPIEMLVSLHPEAKKPRGEIGEGRGDEVRKFGEGAAGAAGATAAVEDFSFCNFVGYYGLSKLCVMWWTAILARRVALRFFPADDEGRQLKVFVACCHPGVITTHLYRDLLPGVVLDYILYYPSLLIGKTWTEGAQAVLKPCIEPDNMVHGGYYLCSGECGPKSGVNCLSKHAVNMDAAKQFCMWAEAQIETQKNAPKRRKLDATSSTLGAPGAALPQPRRIMTVKIT